MGIILGALGGAADNVGNALDQQWQSDLSMQRAEALEQFKSDLANRQRQAMVDRVSTAAGTLADQQMSPLVAQEQAGITDPDSWTPEQQAAVDQSNALTRQGLIAKAVRNGDAGIATGDITPEQAATLNTKSDALLYKTLYEQQKEDGRNARADARNDMLMRNSDERNAVMLHNSDARIAAMMDHFSKQGQGNPTKETLQFLDGSRKAVDTEAHDTRALMTSEMATAFTPDQKAAVQAKYAPKLQQIETQRRQVYQDFNTVRTQVGLPPVASDAPAAGLGPSNPATAPGTPANRPPLSAFQKN